MQKKLGRPKNIELEAINKELKKRGYNKLSFSSFYFYKNKGLDVFQIIDKVISNINRSKALKYAYTEYKLRGGVKNEQLFRDNYNTIKRRHGYNDKAIMNKILLREQMEKGTELFRKFKQQFPESKIIAVHNFIKLYEDYEFDEIAQLPISIYGKELLNKKGFYTLKQDIRYVFNKSGLIRFLDKYKNLDGLIKSDRFKYNKICYFFNYFGEKYISRRNYKGKDIHIKRKEQVERILKQIDIQAFYNNWDGYKYIKKIIENDTIYEINEFGNKIELCKL